MQKFTQIIGAKVISAYNCEYLGTVINMQMNKNNTQIKHLIISGADDETTYILPISKIFSLKSAVIIRNKTALSVSVDTNIPNLINAEVVTISGEITGHITDLDLDEKMNIISIISNTQKIEPKNLINFSNGIALINDTTKKYTNHCFAPRITINNTMDTNTVQALAQEENGSVATPRTIIARLPKNFKLPN